MAEDQTIVSTYGKERGGGMFVGGRGKGRGHLGLSAVTHGVKWEESTESSGWEGSVCAFFEFLDAKFMK